NYKPIYTSNRMILESFVSENDLETINLDVDNRWDKFSESPVAKPILKSVKFIKSIWKYFYIEIPSMIHDYRTYKGERVDLNIFRSFLSLIMVLVCLVVTIPVVIIACKILYIPLVIRFVKKIWTKHFEYISLENIYNAIITLVFLIFMTILSPVIVLVGEVAIIITVFFVSLLEIWCVGLLSVRAGFEMIEWILNHSCIYELAVINKLKEVELGYLVKLEKKTTGDYLM
ncbi:471_t:CDS:2, partial [Cetraspora pellucida]